MATPAEGDWTPLFVRVNATADGNNTLIAAVGGKQLWILSYALVVSAAGTITLQDDQGTPAIFATFPLAANGGISYAGGREAPAFFVAAGQALVLNNPVGVDTLGHISYQTS